MSCSKKVYVTRHRQKRAGKLGPSIPKSYITPLFFKMAQNPRCWGQNTSRIQNKGDYATLCFPAVHLRDQRQTIDNREAKQDPVQDASVVHKVWSIFFFNIRHVFKSTSGASSVTR